jgi:hypothetical protein
MQCQAQSNKAVCLQLCVMVIVLSYETALRRPYGITFLASYPMIHRSLVDWAGRGLSWPARMRLDRIAAQVYNEQVTSDLIPCVVSVCYTGKVGRLTNTRAVSLSMGLS